MIEVPLVYDLESILQTDNTDGYECAICASIKSQQYQCTRGHLYCLDCWKQSIGKESQGKCAECRLPITLDTISRNLFYEKTFQNETVSCPYYNHWQSNNTTTTTTTTKTTITTKKEEVIQDKCKDMKYKQLVDLHYKECIYRLVKCAGEGTTCKVMNFKDYQQHAATCPYQVFLCKECGKEIYSKDTAGHIKECIEKVVNCKYCNTALEQHKMLDHVSNQCPEFEGMWIFYEISAFERIKRKDIESKITKSQPRSPKNPFSPTKVFKGPLPFSNLFQFEQMIGVISEHLEIGKATATNRIYWEVAIDFVQYKGSFHIDVKDPKVQISITSSPSPLPSSWKLGVSFFNTQYQDVFTAVYTSNQFKSIIIDKKSFKFNNNNVPYRSTAGIGGEQMVSITAMDHYQSLSFEELRLQDLINTHKHLMNLTLLINKTPS
ncbi:hypothetical protein CYY_009556 [Polysphondylium violaceum]|uniref:TRAF-type domain-containing protein n=1 Tax=Polysphondylium violaceum TaxID=133409 RepID=A0A8J4PMD1_9MYCE|nr:hypothetical protein CYY_009556 [Polysphondylium violaceum]